MQKHPKTSWPKESTLKALPEPSKLAKLQLPPHSLAVCAVAPISPGHNGAVLQATTGIAPKCDSERQLSVGAVAQQSGVFNCCLNALRACVARGCAVLQQGRKSGLRRSNLLHVLGELEVAT